MRSGQFRPKEGRDRPRWRAKLRHRYDRAASPPPAPHDVLEAWINDQELMCHDLERLEAFDLTRYLRETAHIDLSPTERLRKLAVALEASHLTDHQPRGWLALDRIYATGKALDSDDAEIENSRAITAGVCVAMVDDRPDVARRMILAGRAAAARAIELQPSNPHAHYALGMVDYSSKHGSLEAALTCFERALSIDPSYGWARLYRAHCLHDLGRWSEAAQAYSDVDPAFLVGPRAWRYDRLREQRAWCLLQAGDKERALAEFVGILHRYELEPNLARFQMLKELTTAAEGTFQIELSERLAQLRRVIDGGDAPDTSKDERA